MGEDNKEFKGILGEITEEDRLEVHKSLYGIARNLWSLTLIVSYLLTGERFNAAKLKMEDR